MKIAKLFVLFALFSFTCFASEVIQPFGKLLWEDSIQDVIIKLNQIDSVEQVVLKYEDGETAELKGIKDIDQFKAAFSKVSDVVGHRKHYAEKLNFNGTVNRYYSEAIHIIAAFVNIKGVPALIDLEFRSSVGLLVDKIDQIVSDGDNVYYPYVLKSVSLKSNSPVLSESYQEIDQIIFEKYKDYIKKKQDEVGFKLYSAEKDFTRASQSKNYLRSRLQANMMDIYYYNTLELEKYDKRLKEIIAEKAKEKSSKIKDSSDSL